MKIWPEFNKSGALPLGVYSGSLEQVVAHFGTNSRRNVLCRRLARIYQLAKSTGHLARCIIFGSFVTSNPEPNDVDIFLLMQDSFDVKQTTAEARLVFDHASAQNVLGRCAALDGENATIEYWQTKRDGNKRGIVEVT